MEDKITQPAITFDDVLMEPAYSEVVPSDVDVTTKLTKEISLNIPLLSSPMDTVTEHAMAIALAKMGGLGVIHKNMSVQSQTDEVNKVKRSANGIILDPITLVPQATVREARELMDQNNVSGVPNTEPNGHLMGILTRRDLKFLEDTDQAVSEVMTKDNLVTATGTVSLEQAEQILTAIKETAIDCSLHSREDDEEKLQLKKFKIHVIALLYHFENLTCFALVNATIAFFAFRFSISHPGIGFSKNVKNSLVFKRLF